MFSKCHIHEVVSWSESSSTPLLVMSGEPSFPKQAGEVGKNDLIVMGDKRPCKIVEYSVSKTGKHGHAKASYTAVDIFDGRKYEDSSPTTHTIQVPRVETENVIMMANDAEYIQYMKDDGTDGEIAIPQYPEGFGDQVIAAFEQAQKDGQNLTLTIQRSMGIEQVMAYRSDKN